MANSRVVHTFVAAAIQSTMGLPQAPRSDPESSTLQETSNPKVTVDGMSCVRQNIATLVLILQDQHCQHSLTLMGQNNLAHILLCPGI